MSKLILHIFLFIGLVTQAQTEPEYVLKPPRDYNTKPAKNAAFIELAGNAGLYSLNLDRIYLYKESIKLSARGGFAPHMNGYYMEQRYVFENNFILLPNPHHLEFGIGTTMHRNYNPTQGDTANYKWENIWFGTMRCGYRYQKQDDGLFIRAALTPILFSRDVVGFHPDYFQFWVGASIGVSF